MITHQQRLAIVAIALGAAGFGPEARAASPATASFTVSAGVANSCTVSATPLDFGYITSSSVGAIANNTAAGISVTCTADGTYDVGLLGAHTTGEGTSNLANASQTPIPYTLYQDASATTLWGNTPGTNTLSVQAGCAGVAIGNCTGTGAVQNYEVWAKLGTLPTPLHLGTYSDIVTVTVNYY